MLIKYNIYSAPQQLMGNDSYFLVVADPNEENEVEVYSLGHQKNKDSISIGEIDLELGTLPEGLFLNINKTYYIEANSSFSEIGRVKNEFLISVFRTITINYSKKHYTVAHLPKKNAKFEPGKSKVTYAGRVFDEEEISNLIDSSLEFWLTTGRYADEFERSFAKLLNVKNSILVNSGSSANLVAFNTITSPLLKERQFKKGDELITVACGFPTTVVPAIQYGAIPVFLDITFPTYNIDVSRLEEALSPKTKAVMVAHTLGNPFDLQAVKDFCLKHNLWLIEDNCDALGSKYKYNDEWLYTGTIGDIGTSSFYPPHHMTMGEGGAVYMQSNRLKKIAESIRDWGRDCWCPSGKDNTCGKRFQWELGELPAGYDHKYIYSHFGYNLKVTDMQAAIGCAQLKKVPEFIAKRSKHWQVLRKGLDDLSDVFILPEPTENSIPSWFGFLLTIKDGVTFSRREIVDYLETAGIQTRMLFAGNFLRHPAFNEMRKDNTSYRVIGNLENTDKVMNDTFWLGVYPGMSEEMLDYMITKIRAFVGR
ncbi:lipopolysaccharide biosynthesis protein RfbH [Leptospira sp. 201903075]|uniref:lipopolysaccharide biosynthesis protein RfbH n=1 Tax=Leptospira chreensis TaxID=2810035 RepID=UPI001965938F|nr:lipopolysaccharide biosynthesis protein RfbH [Leptospira chreensis]MBM9589053.1 lipopolysaccharide biosynthesis protein RfbH [Leptospira chreensis]